MDQNQKILGTNTVNLLSQIVNKKPLTPTLIHDETIRIIVIIILLLLSSAILYRTMRYYGR